MSARGELTAEEVEVWASQSGARGRALLARLEGSVAQLPGSADERVRVELDEAGLTARVTVAFFGVRDTRELQALLTRAFLNTYRVGARMTVDAATKLSAEVLDGAGGESLESGGGVTVRARHGFVIDVRLDHRALAAVDLPDVCDRVVPLARRVALASDTAGRFPKGLA